MNLIAVEAPAMGMTATGKTPELVDAAFGIVGTRESLQVVANQLIEALAEGAGSLAGLGNELLVDG
jgi:hypothetical protein